MARRAAAARQRRSRRQAEQELEERRGIRRRAGGDGQRDTSSIWPAAPTRAASRAAGRRRRRRRAALRASATAHRLPPGASWPRQRVTSAESASTALRATRASTGGRWRPAATASPAGPIRRPGPPSRCRRPAARRRRAAGGSYGRCWVQKTPPTPLRQRAVNRDHPPVANSFTRRDARCLAAILWARRMTWPAEAAAGSLLEALGTGPSERPARNRAQEVDEHGRSRDRAGHRLELVVAHFDNYQQGNVGPSIVPPRCGTETPEPGPPRPKPEAGARRRRRDLVAPGRVAGLERDGSNRARGSCIAGSTAGSSSR